MNKIDKKLHFLLGKVKEECKKVKNLSDYELKNKTVEFKERLKNGETTDDILPEAFAVCCEADYRVLGMFPFDVQILGGIALHLCYLCEMNTGEGKTLTATMPLYLNGLTGKSSILVTANEYLAIRDAEEMGQVYKFLGLSVEAGVKRDTNEKLDNDSKKDVYNADIVYTTHGALGFDYLLNNLVQSKEDRFMRDFYYVIIDEADSVLLDSASMPLVISGSPRVQSNLYGITDFFVTTLVEDVHYEIEDKKVWLTNKGIEYAKRYFRIENLYSKENFDVLRHIVLALRAHFLLEKDIDYVATDQGEIVHLSNDKIDGPVFISLLAKGKGKLKIVGLHDRHSRKEYGSFLPGGIRKVTSKREEVFMYFDPGDMKPPLNVYFSGYKTQEGFEGFYMMRNMGAPFLLISESRLEGGAFYLGDKEYENLIVSGIQDCLKQLGFDRAQLILSGLSMGTFGALYNGCKLRPHAILLGKPLASLGDIARNERISRPGGFPTSLDVLSKNCGDMSEQSMDVLNHRFWDLFDQTDWSQTKFIVSYMLEDDYDMTAYNRLISHIDDIGVEIIGKGVHGRHNDDTYSIVAWFKNQYDDILKSDFNRGEPNEE
jgi:hypothetical protein